MGSITAVVMYSVRSELDGRPLIILDTRMRRPLLLYVLYCAASHQLSFHLTPGSVHLSLSPSPSPSPTAWIITLDASRHSTKGQRGPCPSFITRYEKISSHDQQYSSPNLLRSLRLTVPPPRGSIPGLRPRFPFYPPSDRHRGQPSPFTLARARSYRLR